MTPPWNLKSAGRSFAQCWHEFFHAPCDARVCAAVRIAFATVVLVHFAVLYPDLDRWFTDAGLLPLDAARRTVSAHAWSLFWHLPSTSAVVHTCFWIAVAQTFMLLVGLLPRLNALSIFLWLVSFQHRNMMIGDGEDVVMRMLGFFLIWMPIGTCWSLNAVIVQWIVGSWNIEGRKSKVDVLSRREQTQLSTFDFRPATSSCLTPGWGLRLFQIQVATIYLSAALEKLNGDSWMNGTALYYVSRLDDFFGRYPVPAIVFDTPLIVALLTWSVVLIELLAPLLIWFRETRRICLVALILFHLGNEWTMHLFLFHWIMLVGCLSFVTADDLRLLSFWRQPSKAIGPAILAPSPAATRLIRGVIFDLDGTLADSRLDFEAMRREMELPPGLPILEALQKPDTPHVERCRAILHRHELEGVERATLLPGVADLLTALNAKGLHLAVATRNSREITAATLRKLGLNFDIVLTRDDGPVKPNPWPVLRICRQWRLSPAEVIIVGDFRFDIESGRAAGCRTVLLTHSADPASYPNSEQADLVLRSLAEYQRLLSWMESQ